MMGSEVALVGGVDVSRETLDALRAFEALVMRWNPAINLVSKATVEDFWQRHVVDSAQVFSLCPADARTCLPVGVSPG